MALLTFATFLLALRPAARLVDSVVLPGYNGPTVGNQYPIGNRITAGIFHAFHYDWIGWTKQMSPFAARPCRISNWNFCVGPS
jgi:hypothetical protein